MSESEKKCRLGHEQAARLETKSVDGPQVSKMVSRPQAKK